MAKGAYPRSTRKERVPRRVKKWLMADGLMSKKHKKLARKWALAAEHDLVKDWIVRRSAR